MNPIVVCLCIFPTFVIFSLVSEGSETHVIMTEIKHVYVCLWDNVCVFALFFHCPKGTVPLQSIRNYVIGYMTVILLVKEGPYLSTALMWHQNHYGRAKLWMAEGTKSVKCMFVKLNFHAPYSLLVSWGLKHLFMQQRDYEV